MKRLVLNRLVFSNFKGFRSLNLDTNGGNVDIYGDNETGKTTLADGWSWLLSGKDSLNRTDFEIKELDEEGNVKQHKLEHSVEGFLTVDGRPKTLKRVFAEKWTKKRGSLTDTFEGHTTTYYVDGIPVSKKEYDGQVADLIPEKLFKLLTIPTFFNEQIKWQERRELLFEVCGSVTEAEILHSNKALAPLETILQERKLEDHKKTVAASMKRINKEIDDIPVRISEAHRSIPDVSELSEEFLQDDLQALQSRIASKEQELTRVQSGGQAAELRRRLSEIEAEQLSIKNRLQTQTLAAVEKQRQEVDRLHRQLDQLKRQIDDYQYTIRTNEQRIIELDSKREQLRAEYAAEDAKQFDHTADDNCPACGQALPEAQRQATYDKALAEFNRRKAQVLEVIHERGHTAKAESEKLTAENERLAVEIEKLNVSQHSLLNFTRAGESVLDRLRESVKDPTSDQDYERLSAETVSVRKQIASLEDDSQQEQALLRGYIHSLRNKASEIQVDMAKFDQVRRQQSRISELEKEQKVLAAEYEKLQHELYLIEEFTRTKVNMLQSRIDSRFRLAKFKLFREQINGGLEEVCITTYKGVPYDGGLNKAAQANVGIDIINTMSEYYGMSAPIFIDNAESVTKLTKTDAQVIRLVVSEDDKKLRAKGGELSFD